MSTVLCRATGTTEILLPEFAECLGAAKYNAPPATSMPMKIQYGQKGHERMAVPTTYRTMPGYSRTSKTFSCYI
jgi:hypothetical protein